MRLHVYASLSELLLCTHSKGGFSYNVAQLTLNSFPASRDFCHLLIIFANSLYPDQARQNIGPDLEPNCLTL